MQNIHDTHTMTGLLARLDKLTPETPALWGKMNVAQMLAHCSAAVEMQLGEREVKANFIGRIIGPLLRNAVTSEGPFKKGSPTAAELVIADSREFHKEKANLEMLIKRLCQSSPDIFKNRKHAFFGNMTPQQWNNLSYKHLDHHFQQFGV